ncbi:hypothetical protein [Tychonema bourrellyi]|uniref:hypothetical protein n=1 Tax=Tychonema bourrellyi TaxID=54313 RepID=UPI0015D512CB|nr:hypothetical protein [Tychonema bourrellyi]
MPVTQENQFFVEQASCLFIKGLLRMVQYLSWNKQITNALCPMPHAQFNQY